MQGKWRPVIQPYPMIADRLFLIDYWYKIATTLRYFITRKKRWVVSMSHFDRDHNNLKPENTESCGLVGNTHIYLVEYILCSWNPAEWVKINLIRIICNPFCWTGKTWVFCFCFLETVQGLMYFSSTQWSACEESVVFRLASFFLYLNHYVTAICLELHIMLCESLFYYFILQALPSSREVLWATR